MRRSLSITLLVALMVTVMVVGATPAFAGEVNGHNGLETAAPSHANSICAFSGLNDYPDGSQSGPPGRTQSYGQDVKSGRISPHDFNPGDACRGGSNPDNTPS
jgi:hypothetical protein